jgi:hypothetical protein
LKCRPRRRRGSATLWLIIWLPCLLTLFCVLVGVANLWLARVELENALEASALAAVKQWGEAGGGPTLTSRNVGVAYAGANIVRGNSVVIGTNYNPLNLPNENDLCDPTDETVNPPNGNLVFGAIDDDDPDHVIFDAGAAPTCAAGRVLIDATGSGGGSLAADNAWGISFYNTVDTNPLLRIDRVVIDLRAGGGIGSFIGPAEISDNLPSPAVEDQSAANSQPDVVGFTNLDFDPAPAFGQIQFSYPSPGKLQIDFTADGMNDDGFAPGDRFRFGQDVDNVSKGGGQDDGDGIGRDGTSVTVFFSIGGIPQPPLTGVVGTFVDNTERHQDCLNVAMVSPETGTLIVHPALVPDLPCPVTSAPNNNGQSYVLLNATGSGKFGVRAQAIIPVVPLNLGFLGPIVQLKYCVQAKATAEYDCTTGRIKLVRIDEFICP